MMITNTANYVKSFLQRNISSYLQIVKETCYKEINGKGKANLVYSSTVRGEANMPA